MGGQRHGAQAQLICLQPGHVRGQAGGQPQRQRPVARQLGLDTVPLLCCCEIPVPGSMERVIRVMLHYYAPEDTVPEHVYIGATQKLRADLNAAQ